MGGDTARLGRATSRGELALASFRLAERAAGLIGLVGRGGHRVTLNLGRPGLATGVRAGARSSAGSAIRTGPGCSSSPGTGTGAGSWLIPRRHSVTSGFGRAAGTCAFALTALRALVA